MEKRIWSRTEKNPIVFVFSQSCSLRGAPKEITLIYWAYRAAADPSGCSTLQALTQPRWTERYFLLRLETWCCTKKLLLYDVTLGVCRVTMLLRAAERKCNLSPALWRRGPRHFLSQKSASEMHLVQAPSSDFLWSHWVSVEPLTPSGDTHSLDSLCLSLWSYWLCSYWLCETTDSLWNHWLSVEL